MNIDIESLNEEELSELNHRIVERLKHFESLHTHQEMMQFSVGELVSFEPSGRGLQTGTLVKYNKKTVTVIAENGRRWNVSPQLLSRAQKPVEPIGNACNSQAYHKSANVVAINSRR